MILNNFSQIWVIDFEFFQPAGEQPEVLCMVAREYYSARQKKLWLQGTRDVACPIPSGSDVLIVTYYGIAEFSCFLALNWDLPMYTIDLYVEAKKILNGKQDTKRLSLVNALKIFEVEFDFTSKQSMRDLAMRGGLYTDTEQRQLLDYCESDVKAETLLYTKLSSFIDIDRALLRGRYVETASHVEFNGIPFDNKTWCKLKNNLKPLQSELILRLGGKYDVFEAGSWRQENFEALIKRLGIQDWPLTQTGNLKTDKDTLREMADIYPELEDLRKLKQLLGQLRPAAFGVGKDNRHRYMQSVFSSKTGRNQPSTSKCIWAAHGCFRGLITPSYGTGVASIDWSQQELGIAAALSGDKNMKEAYLSGDPYLSAAKKAGVVPGTATKESHPTERGLFKQTSLGVLFGMTKYGLARKARIPLSKADELMNQHKSTYKKFWQWNSGNVDAAYLNKTIFTVFGWEMFVGPDTKENTLMNFPMQANGAEMLRLAMILTHESGVKIIASVHDSIVIEAPMDMLDEHVFITRKAMGKASEMVLDGFKLRTDVEVCHYPGRFINKNHLSVWELIWSVLEGKSKKIITQRENMA